MTQSIFLQSRWECRTQWSQRSRPVAALDISTGPLARRTFQTAGPVRASTFYISLARTDHLDICRAIRFQIVLARTMTNHIVHFSRGARPTSRRDASRSRACQSNTLTFRVRTCSRNPRMFSNLTQCSRNELSLKCSYFGRMLALIA